MKQDFFKFLPSEIITEILSRLPIRTIVTSKCVSKPWLHLLESDEFINAHTSKSVLAMAYMTNGKNPEDLSSLCTVFEFEDGLDLDHHDLHYRPLTNFDFVRDTVIRASVNGLLLIEKRDSTRDPGNDIYVCNPITREYVKLDSFPKKFTLMCAEVSTFGFGVSKESNQYKVVMVCNNPAKGKYECHVHTLGTKTWRCIELGAPFDFIIPFYDVFVNGELHWLASDLTGNVLFWCLDLETEQFSTYSTPIIGDFDDHAFSSMCALGDQLCFCDNTSQDTIVIWLMECGDTKSWTKLVFPIEYEFIEEFLASIYPLKFFKDGDILMLVDGLVLAYYSGKTKSIEIISDNHSSILFNPSFFSVKKLGMVNDVVSF